MGRGFSGTEEDFYHLDFEHLKYGEHIEVETQYEPEYEHRGACNERLVRDNKLDDAYHVYWHYDGDDKDHWVTVNFKD